MFTFIGFTIFSVGGACEPEVLACEPEMGGADGADGGWDCGHVPGRG